MKRISQYKKGSVYLIGAGPGNPELITVRGFNALKQADVIVYDRLANPKLLSLAKENTEHIYVGKRPGRPSVAQQQINHILVTKAQEHKIVVRLKGGDPFIYGRGGEECKALRSENIPYEVVPGISSVVAAPAYAGIPLTHRKQGRSFTVVTGHTITGSDSFNNWDHLAHADTLVILMGVRNLPDIAQTLIQFGRSADTPAALIERATYAAQKVVTGSLGNIAERAEGISPPATIVVGNLVTMHDEIAWFKNNSAEHLSKEEGSLISKFAG